jgi:hypothetical protein
VPGPTGDDRREPAQGPRPPGPTPAGEPAGQARWTDAAPPPLSGERLSFAVVDELCRMQLQARRLGCTIRVDEANAHVRELIELAGLADLLLGAGAAGRHPSAERPGQAGSEDVDPDHDGR